MGTKRKISYQCHECIHLDNKCQGKESIVPCMSKKTAHEYGQEKLKEIRKILKGGK